MPKGKRQRSRRAKTVTNAYELRNHFFLEDYNTAITREDFETFFTKTKEKVIFTFNGWDGKSHTATVYRTSIKGYENVRLIKVGKGLHYIDEDRMINAIELRQMSDFFHVSMESLLKSPSNEKNINAVHAFTDEVRTPSARKSLQVADEMADMVLFYARMISNAEELDKAWEA